MPSQCCNNQCQRCHSEYKIPETITINLHIKKMKADEKNKDISHSMEDIYLSKKSIDHHHIKKDGQESKKNQLNTFFEYHT
jgi:hypothetical protein